LTHVELSVIINSVNCGYVSVKILTYSELTSGIVSWIHWK